MGWTYDIMAGDDDCEIDGTGRELLEWMEAQGFVAIDAYEIDESYSDCGGRVQCYDVTIQWLRGDVEARLSLLDHERYGVSSVDLGTDDLTLATAFKMRWQG